MLGRSSGSSSSSISSSRSGNDCNSIIDGINKGIIRSINKVIEGRAGHGIRNGMSIGLDETVVVPGGTGPTGAARAF